MKKLFLYASTLVVLLNSCASLVRLNEKYDDDELYMSQPSYSQDEYPSPQNTDSTTSSPQVPDSSSLQNKAPQENTSDGNDSYASPNFNSDFYYTHRLLDLYHPDLYHPDYSTHYYPYYRHPRQPHHYTYHYHDGWSIWYNNGISPHYPSAYWMDACYSGQWCYDEYYYAPWYEWIWSNTVNVISDKVSEWKPMQRQSLEGSGDNHGKASTGIEEFPRAIKMSVAPTINTVNNLIKDTRNVFKRSETSLEKRRAKSSNEKESSRTLFRPFSSSSDNYQRREDSRPSTYQREPVKSAPDDGGFIPPPAPTYQQNGNEGSRPNSTVNMRRPKR